MKKSAVFAVAFFGISTAAFAQRFDVEPVHKSYTEAEKAAIQNAIAAEKRYASLEVTGTFQEGDFGEGLEIRNFWDSMTPRQKAEWDKGMEELSALKGTDVPAQYSWVFDGGRKPEDMVTVENGEVLVYMNGRTQADFNALMALVKAHGFTLDPEITSFGGISAYEARSASGARCSIMFTRNNLMVAFH